MVACIMNNLSSVKHIVKSARKRLSPKDYQLFINIKVAKEMGGNNALLYACNSKNGNSEIVEYLIGEAGANPDIMNDWKINCLLMSTKKA